MPQNERLRAALAELESQLRASDSLDAETQAALREAAAGIHAKLDPPAAYPKVDDLGSGAAGELEGSLRARMVDFEASHPQLAQVVTRVIDLLGQAGI